MDPPDLDLTYGALLIGVFFATFFQGVLSVQTYVYFENFPSDKWKMKAFVAGIWSLDFLHLVLISQNSYYYLVTNWGKESALGLSTWEGDMHPAISGFVGFICQLFYIQRIWIFSGKNKPLVLLLTSLCLTTFALDVTISANLISNRSVTEFSSLTTEAIVLFAMGAGTDVVMALLLCYYIRRARSGFKKTNYIISRVVRYTITTSLATSLLAIGCLIAYFSSPNSLIFIAMHFSLARAYTNSLLANLNSRRKIKDGLASQKMKTSADGATTRFHFRTMGTASGTSKTGDTSFHTESSPPNATDGDIQHISLRELESGRGRDEELVRTKQDSTHGSIA